MKNHLFKNPPMSIILSLIEITFLKVQRNEKRMFKKLKQLVCSHYYPGSMHSEYLDRIGIYKYSHVCIKCGKEEYYLQHVPFQYREVKGDQESLSICITPLIQISKEEYDR